MLWNPKEKWEIRYKYFENIFPPQNEKVLATKIDDIDIQKWITKCQVSRVMCTDIWRVF